VTPGNKTDALILKVLKYFNQLRNGSPTYLMYKKRNMDVIGSLFKECGGRHGIHMFGDANNYMS